MVSHKRLDFGFEAYHLPANARARRSARKRRFFENKCGDGKICEAFDLLATIAGNLLSESENSQSSSFKPVVEVKDNCGLALQSTVKNELPCQENPVKAETLYEASPDDDTHCGPGSIITNPDDYNSCKVEGSDISDRKDSCEVDGVCDDDDAMVMDMKPGIVASLGSSTSSEPPMKDGTCGTRVDVNLVSRDDDDENFPRHIHSSRTKKSYRSVTQIGVRRIRKILASSSRYHRGGMNNLDMKARYAAKRNHYLQHQRNFPIKKRKYFDQFNELNCEKYHLHSRMRMRRGNRTNSSVKCQNGSYVSRDSHVRLQIKSFRVPELFIEMPETATVGSLKRRVMEAVRAVLGGGLRVGLMLQGKQVRDDSKTLIQTGISRDNTHLDSLGFCLEPSSLSSHVSVCDVIDSADAASAPSPADSRALVVPMEAVPVAPSPLTTKLTPRPPLLKTSKRSEQAAQRRIRRPFSVTEVEALVEAVEKLGTGRWRDVKLCSFEKADHRTYVDLKDKWKTLVHTAKIAPHQRRGEPVPQALLDRVLNAHGFWSQHHRLKLPLPLPQPQPSPQLEMGAQPHLLL